MAFHHTSDIKPFAEKIWLSSPTMHGEEAKYMMEAYNTNWMSTVGKNLDEIEKQIAEFVGVKYAVALSAGTAALHLATKLAGKRHTVRHDPMKVHASREKFYAQI